MSGSPGGLVELKQLHFAHSGGTPLCPDCDHPILVTGLISDLIADPHNSHLVVAFALNNATTP
jgi:hypothetical protein